MASSSSTIRPPVESRTDQPNQSSETLQASRRISPARLVGWIALGALVFWSYLPALSGLVQRWMTDADYSHGFLVPVFSLYLLWHRRKMAFELHPFPSAWLGLLLIGASGAMRAAAAYFHHQLLDPLSLIPCLAGVVLFVGGWQVFLRAWPTVAFLVFMIPLPGMISGILSHPLQRVATISSVFVLQTIGVPAIDQGNIIWLTNGPINIVEACSGLSMLIVFFAMTVGASFVIQRPLWEKLFIIGSGAVIAVITNIIRISMTGIAHETWGPQVANDVFHGPGGNGLAGLLMPPIGLLLLWLEMLILSRLLIERPEGPLQLD